MGPLGGEDRAVVSSIAWLDYRRRHFRGAKKHHCPEGTRQAKAITKKRRFIVDYVKYERKGPVVIVTLNRPERLNALSMDMGREISAAFTRFRDDEKAKVAIITGAGRAFCVGQDVKDTAEKGRIGTTNPQLFVVPYGTMEILKPVIAAIHGYCLGGGLNWVAMGADIRIAAESAVFGLPEVAVGISVCMIPFASQNIPTTALMDLAITGENISAQRARELGFVSRVVPDEELMPTAMKMAQKIAEHSPLAIQVSKHCLLKLMERSEAGAIVEQYRWLESAVSEDCLEGVAAFLEKRKPVWKS